MERRKMNFLDPGALNCDILVGEHLLLHHLLHLGAVVLLVDLGSHLGGELELLADGLENLGGGLRLVELARLDGVAEELAVPLGGDVQDNLLSLLVSHAEQHLEGAGVGLEVGGELAGFGARGYVVAEEGVRLAVLLLKGRTREGANLEPGQGVAARGHLLVVVEHLVQQVVRLGEVRVDGPNLRELGSRFNLLDDKVLGELLDNLGAVGILEVELLLVRLGGGEGARLEGIDRARLDDAGLEEVGGGFLHGERHLRVGDAEDAVPWEEELGLLLAECAGGDEDEFLELAA
mmetsp:Transcript_10702/g.49160  ORF Transcript_10702/g.49160 Transcript_10702/m.49160 type:complete len:291 (+) Transcript_10702:1498-2370(+)